MMPVQQMTEAELVMHARPDTEAGIGALRTERGNLPLEEIDVAATITGLAQRTELTQGFRNPYDQPLEATYIFPLPDRAAVTALRMRTADRVVEGVLRERGAARADYQQAVEEGRRAAIVEEERPGVFTMRVGNIAPGEQVTVALVLAGVLPFDYGEATYRFPLVVAPRYIPGAALGMAPVGSGTEPDTDAVPDASRITPPVLLPGFPNPIRLSVRVDIDPAGLSFVGITSSVPVRTDDQRRLFLEPGQRANQDFVLRLRPAAADAPRASLAIHPDESGDGGTFALTVVPPDGLGLSAPRDVVLVLDRSGSMSGWKMVAARRAAARIVDTLAEADRFAVLAFDHEVESPPQLGPGLHGGTDRNRFRAVEHLASAQARGGTELLKPLRAAVDLLHAGTDTTRERVIILVTDGQVGNEDQILRSLAPTLPGIRVHTVGVDTAANSAFLRRLSALGGGRCELVESEDRLDAAMRAIHRRIATPLVTGLSIGSTELTLDLNSVAPQPFPDLFADAPVLLTGRVHGEAIEHDGAAVTVTGTGLDGAQWSQTLLVQLSNNDALPAIWARAHIRDLEDRYVSAAVGGDHPQLTELEREIVRTSLTFGVLCRFTAFVAVDTEIVNPDGTQKQVIQPVDLPAGWELPVGPKPLVRAPLPMRPPAGRTPIARNLNGTFAGNMEEAQRFFAGTASSPATHDELAEVQEPAPSPEPSMPSAVSSTSSPASAEPRRERAAGRGRARVRRTTVSHLVHRNMAGYGPAAQPAATQLPQTPPVPESVREFARRARQRLGEQANRPAEVRRAALAELAKDIDRSIDRFAADGLIEPGPTLLRTLATELARPIADQAELEHRWLHALDVLEPLAGEEPAAAEGRATPFWKR